VESVWPICRNGFEIVGHRFARIYVLSRRYKLRHIQNIYGPFIVKHSIHFCSCSVIFLYESTFCSMYTVWYRFRMCVIRYRYIYMVLSKPIPFPVQGVYTVYLFSEQERSHTDNDRDETIVFPFSEMKEESCIARPLPVPSSFPLFFPPFPLLMAAHLRKVQLHFNTTKEFREGNLLLGSSAALVIS
jgi:hypothetical protein